ncbi:MAG: 23S rRNA (uracil(1939)-C(5))-methyltransferase RlmD [Candidatus Margulisiibacteriota bacterium]
MKILTLDEKGRGVGPEGLHVSFAYPGDEVEAILINRRKKTGRLVKLIEGSPNRQTPPCPYFGRCGGCPWQGLKYKTQLQFKEARIKTLFGDCQPIIPSPDEYGYRNRMDYAFGPEHTLGLKDDRDNIIDLDRCLLASARSNELLARLRQFSVRHDLKEYDRGQGLLRHVVIREGLNIKNAVLNVITSNLGEFPLETLWEELKGNVEGITWSVNLSPADRSYGDLQATLGQDYLLESLLDLKFKVPVQSFFQTNTRQAERLLQVIKDFAGLQGGEMVFDLYAGTGSIGLSLADRAREVIGLEENEAAVALSRANAELNGLKNFTSLAGRVEAVIASLGKKPEIVILDPPRPGLHKKVIQELGKIGAPKIVYASCNPTTQQVDVAGLTAFGYQIKQSQPLDMFPHTPHIENVILLVKRS